jgi:hypothetical protein
MSKLQGQVSDLPVEGVSDSARGRRPLQPADQEVCPTLFTITRIAEDPHRLRVRTAGKLSGSLGGFPLSPFPKCSRACLQLEYPTVTGRTPSPYATYAMATG